MTVDTAVRYYFAFIDGDRVVSDKVFVLCSMNEDDARAITLAREMALAELKKPTHYARVSDTVRVIAERREAITVPESEDGYRRVGVLPGELKTWTVSEFKLTTKVLNAFSLNMIKAPARINVEETTLDNARKIVSEKLESAVGHADTATVYSVLLGTEIPAVRSTVSLNRGEIVLVGQYRGPRLPEGAKELPAGASIQWLLVTVE
jgi:hypothetical protein